MFHSVLYSSLSLLSSLLLLLLLPWFIQFKSIPGLFAIAWLFVVDVLYGLNPLILGDGLPDSTGARAYCDIASKLLIGLQTAIPVTMLCFSFTLEDWLVRPGGCDVQRKHIEHRKVPHFLICLASPVVSMVLHVAVQDHRFDFVENVGCIPSVSISVVGWIFVWLLPAIPSCMASIYLIFIFRYRSRTRRIGYELRDKEAPSPSSEVTLNAFIDKLHMPPLAPDRIVRLGIMICVVVLWTYAMVIYALAISAKSRELVFASRPDLSRIEFLESFSGSPSASEIEVLLLTAPFFSVLLFAASIDKNIFSAISSLANRGIRRSTDTWHDPDFDLDKKLTSIPTKRGVRERTDSEQILMHEVARLIWELEGRRPLVAPEPAFDPRPRIPDRWLRYENRSRETMQQRPRRGSREYDAAMWLHAQARDPRPLSTIVEGSSIASTEDLRSLITNSTTPSRVRDFLVEVRDAAMRLRSAA